MPLKPVTTSTDSVAEQAAQNIIRQITQTATAIARIRAEGIPARPAQPARQLPNGQIAPAQDAVPAATGAEIDAKLGVENVAVLDALSAALK